MYEREIITLEPRFGAGRIDKYIAEETTLTRNSAAILIEGGHCLVNGRKVNKNYKICANDLIEITLPPNKETEIEPQDINLDIVYEDSDLLVINKPRGMVVHPAHGHEKSTVVNALLYHCKDSLSGINGEIRPGIVHRIDMNTSGLLLVAKSDFAHLSLAEQLKQHSIKREYEAVVCGIIKSGGTVNAPIGRDQVNRKRMAVTDKNSKSAVTHYYLIENLHNASHIRLVLETGRTHQIRVHMAFIGHAILGDDLYGNGKPKWLAGQCLHAKKLGFIHPRSNEYLEFDSMLPDYFSKLLVQLRSN